MPPRRGCKRQRQLSSRRYEQSASGSYVPPPEPSIARPPPPPVEVPPPPPVEAFQAFMTFWNVYTAQAQAGNVPLVATPTLALVAPSQSTNLLSKQLKEAQNLGCENFSGTLNAITAKN